MEEKIIDGINIAECEFAIKPINDNRIKCHCVKGLLQISKMQEQPESIKGSLCENNPNCYYKQLKRLEQENERLKEEFTSFMNGDYCAESCKKMNNAFQDAHKGILKENEELKNILTNIDKKLELALDVEQTDAEESFDLLYTIQDLIREAIGNELLEE